MTIMLKLERSGRFNTTRSMIPNAHKCGSMGSKVYSYTVRIEATDSRLTVEGFLLNNELVGTYFETKYGRKAEKWDAMSCELMAMTAAKELADMICNQGVDCRKVHVSITGSNGAMITASWEKADAPRP
jgi:hypothetical protein